MSKGAHGHNAAPLDIPAPVGDAFIYGGLLLDADATINAPANSFVWGDMGADMIIFNGGANVAYYETWQESMAFDPVAGWSFNGEHIVNFQPGIDKIQEGYGYGTIPGVHTFSADLVSGSDYMVHIGFVGASESWTQDILVTTTGVAPTADDVVWGSR